MEWYKVTLQNLVSLETFSTKILAPNAIIALNYAEEKYNNTDYLAIQAEIINT